MKYGTASLIIILLALSGCKDNSVAPPNNQQKGSVGLTFDKPPAGITQLVARLHRDGYDDRALSLSVADTANGANFSFVDVPVGTWHLKVSALNDSGIVRYFGETDVDVLPGEATLVMLQLVATTGRIDIEVTWAHNCTPMPSGLLSWWTGDNTSDDPLGHNDGFLLNGASYAFGKVRKAFMFDGINGGVLVPDAENLRFTGSFTVEGWIKIASFPTTARQHGQIFFRGDDRDSLDPYYICTQPNGKVRFHVESLTSSMDLETPIDSNIFIHLAAVLDTSTSMMQIFLNGSPKAEIITAVRPFRNLDSLKAPALGIGNINNSIAYDNQPFHGLIDELSVYNRALSLDEIRKIFDAGSAGKCK